MKSKDYIKKYDLNNKDKFDHSSFVFDLTNDFNSTIEWYKSSGEYSESKFWQSVTELEDKYESIFTRCKASKPEKLWGYFRATIVKPTYFELFPDKKELDDKLRNYNIIELASFVRDNTDMRVRCYVLWNNNPNSNDLKGDLNNCYHEINEYEYPFHIETAIRTYIRRLKSKLGRKMEEEEKERKKWEEQNRRRRTFFEKIFSGEFDPFFYAMFGSIYEKMYMHKQMMMCPAESFDVLGLDKESTEDQIKKSFRDLAFKYRQDRGDNKNRDKFISIVEAKNKCIAYIKLKENATK